MSQQEFFPESQSHTREQSLDHDELERIRPWQARSKTSDMPKSEHPSAYEESLPPYSYRAQDSASATLRPPEAEHAARSRRDEHWQQRQQFGPDGDAFEQGYRPYTHYNMYQQVPPWARPQHHGRGVLRWVVLAILGVLLIKPLLFLLGGMFILGITLVALVGFLAVCAIIALIALALLGVPLGRWDVARRWGRPWGW